MRLAKTEDYDVYHQYMNSEFGAKYVSAVCNSFDFESVLDVGCAKGFALDEFKKYGIKTFGCDVSKEALSVCGHEHQVLTPKRPLPFKDKEFDLVFCTDVLEHLEEPDAIQLIKELERVASKYIFATICFRPSQAFKPRVALSALSQEQIDLCNTEWHLTIKPREWWESQFTWNKVKGWETKEEPNFFVYELPE